MAEFCAKCCEKEAQMEILRTVHYKEMESVREELKRLQEEVDKLSFDLAFYSGNIINLSCNNK